MPDLVFLHLLLEPARRHVQLPANNIPTTPSPALAAVSRAVGALKVQRHVCTTVRANFDENVALQRPGSALAGTLGGLLAEQVSLARPDGIVC